MGELLATSRRRKAWHLMSLVEKQRQLKSELLEEMVTMATQLRLQLSVEQIVRAIDQTEYNALEVEEQHRSHAAWVREHLGKHTTTRPGRQPVAVSTASYQLSPAS